jgi:hypothetical protein
MAFRVNRTYPKILRNRKQRIARRLDSDRRWPEQPQPMMSGRNIHFEMAQRGRAISCGGIGALHLMGHKLGLAQEIDRRLHLLKRHLPYHESDHVLNLAYNALLWGQRLEDIELRRNDEAFLDALGAQRIPDPTTSGEILPAVLTKGPSRRSWRRSTPRANGSGKPSRRGSLSRLSLTPMAPLRRPSGSVRAAWPSPIKAFGAMSRQENPESEEEYVKGNKTRKHLTGTQWVRTPPGKGWPPTGSEHCVVGSDVGTKRMEQVLKPCD